VHHPSLKDAAFVPLPKRSQSDTQHQIALTIRDGRRAAQQLAALEEPSKTSLSSRETESPAADTVTSMSTVLEQDFTVEGKKGDLRCPFSAGQTDGAAEAHLHNEAAEDGRQDPTPHLSADPICAAMYEEALPQPAPPVNGSTGVCPIRFLDQHSPEEVAHYVETHKHELPRSHEVCLSRYQRSEDQIRKLDAKYGNLVSMIQDLSQLHKPMLPDQEPQYQSEVDRASNQRVESWAQAVSVTASEPLEEDGIPAEDDDAAERQSHFDRPLKEVRVGESPSRPWGISVPIYEPIGPSDDGQPVSPPPAPVRMPSPIRHDESPKLARKCPFDHTKLTGANALRPGTPKAEENPGSQAESPKVALPFTPGSQRAPEDDGESVFSPRGPVNSGPPPLRSRVSPVVQPQPPAFLNPQETKGSYGNAPQMVFTGPVFIGYPIEQAIQFMQHYRGNQ
jgi:hypothetical protein